MNHRERYLASLLFQKTDRIPLIPGGGRESTRKAWYSQGLPRSVKDIPDYAYRQVGGKLDWQPVCDRFSVNERMIPQFEEMVLERKQDSQIVQDWKGNICEISNEYSVEYLRNAIDFVTRRWIKCPVESYSDWEDMKKRYDPDTPERLPSNAHEIGNKLVNRDVPLIIGFSGPFWQLREWLGFENLCLLFHDDPAWVQEMIEFWKEYLGHLLRRMFASVVPDMVLISEDMAYKRFPMISPAMTRQYLLPVYQHWARIITEGGCPLFAIDSDGSIGDLIPIWIEAGVHVAMPMEVAAGNDLITFRQRFGHQIAFQGGIDKRLMAQGGNALCKEFERLKPVIQEGGFIPTCDHAVPADVSWKNYCQYIELLGTVTGWL
jgi:uroporphyrinogen decarboxylase